MIKSILVLGGGSAGLIAAVTLKRRLPQLQVRVSRSPEIGVIGVGEGTTAQFGVHFFNYLGFNPRRFYAEASPTWKLGIRFLWGMQDFYYSFTVELGQKYNELPRPPGFYVDAETRWTGPGSACMAHNRAFYRQKNGAPDMSLCHAYHVENQKLVKWLENTATSLGVEIINGTMREAEGSSDGEIAALLLENGSRLAADLFVDASGFRSELLRRTLAEPWVSYADSLFCERAVIGGWPRTDEPIRPYTVAETMNSGWCWQIEHEHWINRGYVYSSRFISDEDALAEFLARNPKVSNEPRVVRFSSGRSERNWIGNVVGIGNASGFVEPLEATALHVICNQSKRLSECLIESLCEPTESTVALCNRANAVAWDDIRDFLAIHYAFNERLDTPFWRHCRNETNLGGVKDFVNYYRKNGPGFYCAAALLNAGNSFGLDGYYALLLGQRVSHECPYQAPPQEAKLWRKHLEELGVNAKRGFTVEQALAAIRHPSWQWGATGS
jgi:tryptophan halogenase